MPRFTEKSVVEDYFINKLQDSGWRFVPADVLERESLEEPLLTSNLLRALNRLNADIGIGSVEIKHVLNELKLKASGIEGSKQILNFFKSGVAVKFEKERVVKFIRLFDYDNPDNNEFIVSRQTTYQSGDKTIRADIMLYINGIPLAIIECKNPVSFSTNWFEGYRQIKDYEKAVPELFKYVQVGVAAEQIARYFPIVPWQDEVKLYEWREGEKDSIDSTIEFFSPAVLLDIVRNFLFFRVEMGNATKVITRYMQYRAANKVVERVLNHLDGKEKKNKGLIWHWQGSGKTLTMIFAANKLYQAKRLENPTIFFIVDRIELEEQLSEEFAALDMPPEIISSIGELRKVIRHDEGGGRRGIMLTLIHKFRPEEMDELRKELNELAERNKETIQTRKNVIAFIDEGHRTQYGMLAAQMKSILKNAFFFAFTGTPISKKGKNTYQEFSYLPDEPYFDKYFITDSIKDGFTVRIAYQPRLEKEVHLKKDLLETFLEVEYEELPEDIREKVKDSVREKLNTIKVVLENPDRIKRVSEDIARHFKENVEGKFKAMVVAVSRESCVRYKRELDKLLPKEYSEVIMTFTGDDPDIIQSYLKELRVRFRGKEIEDIRKDVVEKFKEEEFPKLLIVTDMLLTGFDAPVLQTMYLDKPLKEHKLLQAIARTNRPYRDVKEAGLILDYVGMLGDFRKAFEMYSKDEIKGALYNIEELRTEFSELMNKIMKLFEDLPKDARDREVLLAAFSILTSDEAIGKKFLEDYKLLRRIFELLGPDEIKVELFSEYTWITQIYIYYIKQVMRSQPEEEKYVEKYFDKTIKYVHRTTEIENLKKDLPIIVFDEHYLKNLEEKVQSKEEKAANIVFTLNRFVLVDKHKNLIYESLTEKVERILKLWKEKTKDFERIYREGSEVIDEIERLSARKKELGYSDLEYSLLLVLENRFGKGNESLIKDVEELSEILKKHMFTGWTSQPMARKDIERELRTFLRKKYLNKPSGIVYKEIDDLCFMLKEDVETYGKEG